LHLLNSSIEVYASYCQALLGDAQVLHHLEKHFLQPQSDLLIFVGLIVDKFFVELDRSQGLHFQSTLDHSHGGGDGGAQMRDQ